MIEEIIAGSTFVVNVMKRNTAHLKSKDSKSQFLLSDSQYQKYKENLVKLLGEMYVNHWYVDSPLKGQGYRCLRVNGKVDPLLLKAGTMMGLSHDVMLKILPGDFTMWIDPDQVSYRFGDMGSISHIYDKSTKENLPPTPPRTPENKKIRTSPVPQTPMKVNNGQNIHYSPQVTPPPPVINYQRTLPSNTRRTSPIHYNQQFTPIQQQTPVYFNDFSNCKDLYNARYLYRKDFQIQTASV